MAVEVRTVSSSGGEKGTKLQAYDQLPAQPLEDLAVLYGMGAIKYPPRNWERAYEYSKSFASLMRHLQLFMSGEDVDLELGSNHLTNVAFHCISLFTFNHMHPEFDDRVNSKKDLRPAGNALDTSTHYPVNHRDLEQHTRQGKLEPRYDLIPLAPLAKLAELYGAGKATPVANAPEVMSSYYARLLEHVWLFWGGQDTDENDYHHMIWALHYVFCMLDLFYRHPEYDNRFTPQHGAQPIGFDSKPEVGEKPESEKLSPPEGTEANQAKYREEHFYGYKPSWQQSDDLPEKPN